MDFLSQFYVTDVLHVVSQLMIIPTVAILLLLIVYTVYTLGSLVVEAFVEHRHYTVQLPKLIASLEDAPFTELDAVVAESGLLNVQKSKLHKVIDYLYLPEEPLEEVAKRLLADENTRYQKVLSKTDATAKIGPMLGLMGTLIPLGPGIVALSSGDLETLSSSLLVAFDTTVVGLLVAVVCFLVSKLRRRWYSDYLVSIEGAMNTILDKAGQLRDDGFAFPRPTQTYTDYTERSLFGGIDGSPKDKRNSDKDAMLAPSAALQGGTENA